MPSIKINISIMLQNLKIISNFLLFIKFNFMQEWLMFSDAVSDAVASAELLVGKGEEIKDK